MKALPPSFIYILSQIMTQKSRTILPNCVDLFTRFRHPVVGSQLPTTEHSLNGLYFDHAYATTLRISSGLCPPHKKNTADWHRQIYFNPNCLSRASAWSNVMPTSSKAFGRDLTLAVVLVLRLIIVGATPLTISR